MCIDSVFLLGLHLSEEFLLLVLDLLLPGLGGELLVGPPFLGHLLVLLCLPDGVGADGGVGLLVDGLDTVGVDAVLDVSAEDKYIRSTYILYKFFYSNKKGTETGESL